MAWGVAPACHTQFQQHLSCIAYAQLCSCSMCMSSMYNTMGVAAQALAMAMDCQMQHNQWRCKVCVVTVCCTDHCPLTKGSALQLPTCSLHIARKTRCAFCGVLYALSGQISAEQQPPMELNYQDTARQLLPPQNQAHCM